jgi:hypothetical protein
VSLIARNAAVLSPQRHNLVLIFSLSQVSSEVWPRVKVDNLGAGMRNHEQLCQLDVVVNNALGMGHLKRFRDLDGELVAMASYGSL